MESAVTAPVSGHVKRVVVHEGDTIATISKISLIVLLYSGDSINQGDLTVEIVH
jgi:pyruvate carboxylase